MNTSENDRPRPDKPARVKHEPGPEPGPREGSTGEDDSPELGSGVGMDGSLVTTHHHETEPQEGVGTDGSLVPEHPHHKHEQTAGVGTDGSLTSEEELAEAERRRPGEHGDARPARREDDRH
jgi:hypothetical protein